MAPSIVPSAHAATVCVRSLVGVFTTMAPGDAQGHKAFMRSHADAMLPVFRDGTARLRCGVNIVFVVGSYKGRRLAPDVELFAVHLAQRENMNGGKSFTWLAYATENFSPAADWVWKMDMDVKVCPPVLEAIASAAKTASVDYIGGKVGPRGVEQIWRETRAHGGQSEFVGFCVEPTGRCPRTGTNFSYFMQGGLYGLSRSLATLVVRGSKSPRGWGVYFGPEDLMVGRQVALVAPGVRALSLPCLAPLQSWHDISPRSGERCPARHYYRLVDRREMQRMRAMPLADRLAEKRRFKAAVFNDSSCQGIDTTPSGVGQLLVELFKRRENSHLLADAPQSEYKGMDIQSACKLEAYKSWRVCRET